MHSFWLDRPWRLRVAALACAGLLVGLLSAWLPGALSSAEQVAGDLVWRMGVSHAPERRVMVVDIDEASLQEVGPWPWPRATLARLSERLQAAGAAVQVFDLVLDSERAGDPALSSLWSSMPVVGGQIFSLDPATTPRIGVLVGALARPGCPPFAPRSSGYMGNNATLASGLASVGHLTPRIEFDGVLRKVPGLICHEGKSYPSLALAALWRAAQGPEHALTAADWVWSDANETGPAGLLWAPSAWLTSASLPGFVVPLDGNGDMRVPYHSDRKAFASVSARQVLSGAQDLSMFRGTIVLVGATAFGLGDAKSTPLSTVASGVEVHAQSIVGLLDHRVPYTPRQAWAIQLFAGLVIAGLLAAVAVRRRGAPVKRLPVAGLVLAAACLLVAAGALLYADLWLPWLAPAMFALLGSTALATAEHALTRAQRERLSAHLGSYLPAPVAERLMATDPTGSIQVDQREVSVMVADIRNFSAFAAHRPAEETAALLHAFYCIAVDVVEQYGGVVENVVGDSVMSVWNAYSENASHPEQALGAAKELLRATRALLAHRASPQDEHLVQPVALGIGIESGKAIVGSFGPARRRAHVALGEPVSVASRLQKMTQDLSMPILIGPQLARQLPQASTESLGDYLLEGMSRQYSLYVPSDWTELVPTDQLWLAATSGPPSVPGDGDRWSEMPSAGSSRVHAPAPLRDA